MGLIYHNEMTIIILELFYIHYLNEFYNRYINIAARCYLGKNKALRIQISFYMILLRYMGTL